MMDLDVRKAMPAVQIGGHGGPEAPAHEGVDRGKTVALKDLRDGRPRPRLLAQTAGDLTFGRIEALISN
jgi:hypothetical protein